MKKNLLGILLLLAAGCTSSRMQVESLSLIQIQDRNGVTETVSNTDRLTIYEAVNFLDSQPYKKVLRVYKGEGKNHSKITSYHPNGMIHQYLEAEEMRAHGAYREWFPNGQLKIHTTVIHGTADLSLGSQQDWLFDGLSEVWDEQGHLAAQIFYEKGALQGTSLYFYPTGALEKKVPFVKNDLEGTLTEFFPDGEIKAQTHYKKGQKEGPSLGFFSDGSRAWVEDYTEGLLKSGTYYNPKGELVSEVEHGGGFQALFEESQALTLTEFRVGKPDGMIQKLTPQGNLQKTFHIKNGKKQGEEVEYYPLSPLEKKKPAPKLSIQWNENAIHGAVKTWYDNGQLQSQREYSRNQKMGPSLAWYREGSLMFVEEYEENRLVHGQYYKLNKSTPISLVTHGSGIATLYDETGTLLRKISYLKGKAVDPED